MTTGALRQLGWLSAAVGLLVCGCAGPVGSTAKKPGGAGCAKTRSSASASAGSANPSPNASDVSPVSKLTVQTETIDAADLWRGRRDELREKQETLSPEAFRNFVAQRGAELITDKIAEMLLYQKASLRQDEAMGKRIDAYVDSEIRKIVTAHHDGMQRRYEKYLESQGMTLEQAKAELRRQFIVAGYLETAVRPKVAEPTRAELVAAFEANKESWRKPARRSLSLIDIRTTQFLPNETSEPTREHSQAAREEARSKAQAALAELRGGAAFADVARRYSHDTRAADGGAWGWINPDSLRERYAPALKALDKLRAGQVSEAVETPDGFFIVRCDEFEPAVEPDFLSVQPQLREIAFRRMYNQMVTDLVTELRSKARIEPENLERYHAAVVTAAFDRLASTP